MADYQYINSTGTVVADTSTILTEVQTEYKSVFGADLVVTPDTPQGVLITAETLSRVSLVNNNAALANQINPNIAGGVFLDAIMALTGIQRTPATQTTVASVSLTGVAGTIIPQGTQAKTSAGDVFATQSGVTLDGTGNATVDFASVEYGAIPCAAHALNTIVSNVLGWETVDNDNAGVLGTSTQSDQAARALRQNTLGFQGVALSTAITSALYATENVKSLQYLENYNSTPQGMIIHVTDGATLADTTWSMTTIEGSGTNGAIVVGIDDINFTESLQDVPTPNPWPVAKYTTTGNVTLSGLATQGGGDWSGAMTSGDYVLTKNQTDETENGVWVVAAGSWARQSYNAAASQILASNNGISLVRNSIWCCVDGGSNTDVAAAMLENKSSGCAWNGNTSVTITEPASVQPYTVLFDRPEIKGILIRITTTNGSTVNIKQAVLDYANGNINGLAGFVTGVDVSPFEISGAIMSTYPNYFITKVEISYLSPVSYVTTTLPIALNEIPYTQESYISVVIS